MKKKLIISGFVGIVFFTTTAFNYDFFEIAKQLEIFTTLYKEINMNYVDKVTPAKLMDKAITGMLEELDPYTVYWNEQDVEAAKIKQSGNYTGIGANLKAKRDRMVVIESFEDSPADKAGLKAGDEIIKIGDISLANFHENASELLKGKEGTPIDIVFLRNGEQKQTTITLSKIDIQAVPYYNLIDEEIGYIVLSTFNAKTTIETKAALLDLKKQGAKKIILDLRGNPGGLLNEAVNIVNLFVDKDEVITTTKSEIKKYNKIFTTTQNPVDTEIPLAILINGRSASASEIVAGGLQDLDRAVVIGARSFGKGLVQRTKELTYGTHLKVTISRYYTPSGRCIQALDYGHRDENGDPIRRQSAEYNSFKTRNGRTVYDGGGIQPDIEMETGNYSPVTVALLKTDAIFDFATKYYYSHSITQQDEFRFTDSDFDAFKQYLKTIDFDYQTEVERKFAKAMEIAKDEKMDLAIEADYNQLVHTMKEVKNRAVTEKRKEIESLLTDEIIKRYFYKKGLYDYQIKHNPEIKEAISILKNDSQYRKILRG